MLPWELQRRASRDSDVPGPSRPEPCWLSELRVGRFEAFDRMVESCTWVRPLGRRYRLLLLLAGDIERNPGPTSSKGQQARGDLNLLGGFARATSDRMAKCLKAFAFWCEAHVGLTLEQVVESVEITDLALKAYGLALFKQGSRRYMLVYAITAIQQVRPEFRGHLSGAWQVDRKWQLEEPSSCRAVLSAPVFRAIIGLSLLWGWHSFAGLVALGFGGMLHPNEFICLRRRDIVFPEDTLLEQKALYIFIRNPKTARFARKQHVRIDDLSIQFLAKCVFGRVALESPLFSASIAVFRRQWNAILDRLEVPRRQAEGGATPGTLRGSGATHEYLQSADVQSIQRRGRWNQLRTLEHYIQEVAAQLFIFNLSATSRTRILDLSSNLSCILQWLFPSEFSVFLRSRRLGVEVDNNIGCALALSIVTMACVEH